MAKGWTALESQDPQAAAMQRLKDLNVPDSPRPYGYPSYAREPGNIDLTQRPHVKNADGSMSTVRSMGVNMDGREHLIPTVNDKGYVMSDDDAIREFEQTGKHLGVYGSPDEATQAGDYIHKDQERYPPLDTLRMR